MPGFPQEPITGALAQLMAKLKPGPITGAGFPGQGTPPDMSTIPGAGLPQHQSTPSPYPPEGYIPPLMGPVRVGSLPQDPEAQEYWKADAAAAEQFRQQQAGPVGLPPPIPPLQPPQPPQMPSQDPFAIPQGPPSPIDIQLDPSIPQPHPPDWRMPDFGQNAPPAPPDTFEPPPPPPPRKPGPGPPITIRGPSQFRNTPPTPNLKNLSSQARMR